MSTSTITLLDTVLAELKAHLPALVEAEGLDPPTDDDFFFGERELRPITRPVRIQVDLMSFDQTGGVGSSGRRENVISVIVDMPGPDEETLHRCLLIYLDLMTKVLETEIVIGAARPVVTAADATLSGRFAGSSALFRSAIIEARIRQSRDRGDA